MSALHPLYPPTHLVSTNSALSTAETQDFLHSFIHWTSATRQVRNSRHPYNTLAILPFPQSVLNNLRRIEMGLQGVQAPRVVVKGRVGRRSLAGSTTAVAVAAAQGAQAGTKRKRHRGGRREDGGDRVEKEGVGRGVRKVREIEGLEEGMNGDVWVEEQDHVRDSDAREKRMEERAKKKKEKRARKKENWRRRGAEQYMEGRNGNGNRHGGQED